MKNKLYLKKYILFITIIFISGLSLITYTNYNEYKELNTNYNIKLNNLIYSITSKYDITKEELITILNNNENKEDILYEYGININEDAAIITNNNVYKKYKKTSLITFTIIILSILIFIIYLEKKRNKQINEITNYIKEINNKNYQINIDDNNEDELSLLKNELYKITVMLKEESSNSHNDKILLKNSLSDISHQLKTPLTSINILLDNIIDNPDMDETTKTDFINDIKRETTNIKFLVENILKLSKFDANTIEFKKEKNSLNDIIKISIKNVSALCDLKNIKINLINSEDISQICDFKWQIEALTNILKNCVESEENNSKIDIKCTSYPLYNEIIIKDYGCGIDTNDLPNIFKRFYKGKNASKDSVGIGLALAKTIIEKDNGIINVSSKVNVGTTFTIKYFK